MMLEQNCGYFNEERDDEDEVSVYKEKVDRDCSYCKNGTYRKPIHQFDGTLIRRVNFCDECGRDLRGLK